MNSSLGLNRNSVVHTRDSTHSHVLTALTLPVRLPDMEGEPETVEVAVPVLVAVRLGELEIEPVCSSNDGGMGERAVSSHGDSDIQRVVVSH